MLFISPSANTLLAMANAVAGLWERRCSPSAFAAGSGFGGAIPDPFRKLTGWAGSARFAHLSVGDAPYTSVSPPLSCSSLRAGPNESFSVLVTNAVAAIVSPTCGGGVWSGISNCAVRLRAAFRANRPPTDLLIAQDPLGLAMIAGLVVKEVPF
jgi:putative thiamine transport system permease protein